MNKTQQPEREIVFHLETFQKNRIVNKIIKALERDKNFNVADVESFGDSRIFEIRVFTNDTENEITKKLKDKICDIIRDNFAPNYQFDFKTRRLGWTNSFNVFRANNFCFECYTRIKEIRNDGSSILPEATNQIKV